MIGHLSVVSADGQILGMKTITLAVESGKLRPVGSIVVPILTAGTMTHVETYLPDLDVSVTVPICADAVRVKRGQTVTVNPRNDGVLISITEA
jgi:hypothetical protein